MSRLTELKDLIFVGFNSSVSAIERETGRIAWTWRGPKPQGSRGFVSIMLDGDRLIASVMGHTACLDPVTGRELWAQPFTGFGWGPATLASTRGGSSAGAAAQAIAAHAHQQAAAAMITSTTAAGS